MIIFDQHQPGNGHNKNKRYGGATSCDRVTSALPQTKLCDSSEWHLQHQQEQDPLENRDSSCQFTVSRLQTATHAAEAEQQLTQQAHPASP
jgi:hypothetical protein